jgi:hypothetical protein
MIYNLYLSNSEIMTHKSEITSAVLLDHMRGMENRLAGRIDALESDVGGIRSDMKNFEKKVDGKFEVVNRKLEIMNIGIDNIDKRLDAVEIENLPRRVTKIERHLGIGVG